jgi:hypothetical protein
MPLTGLDWCWIGLYVGAGKILLGDWAAGLSLLGMGLARGAVAWWDLSRHGWSSVIE